MYFTAGMSEDSLRHSSEMSVDRGELCWRIVRHAHSAASSIFSLASLPSFIFSGLLVTVQSWVRIGMIESVSVS